MSSLLIQFDHCHCPHTYVQGKWFFRHTQRLDEQSDLQLHRTTFNSDGVSASKSVKTGQNVLDFSYQPHSIGLYSLSFPFHSLIW